MLALFHLLALLPLTVLHALGWLLGWLVFLSAPRYRQRFLAHARQAGLAWPVVRPAVGAAGQMVLELPRLWFGAPVPVRWQGLEHIEAALQQGRGLLFLTPHLGCFEITAQAYAAQFGQQHQPMTVLFRPPRKSWLRPLVASARTRPGLASAPATVGGVKQLLRALRAGQAVGLLPDQVPPQGQGSWATFFGHPAYTMNLPARLAQQTGATVLLAWGERLSRARGYVVHIQPFSETLASDPEQAAAQVNAAMQALIHVAPQQYLWAYNRYKTPRQNATPGGHDE